jgi:hypothetical protein
MPFRTIESQLFSWEAWDGLEDGVMLFEGITTKVELPDKLGFFTQAGKKFSHCRLDMILSTVTFYDSPEDEVGHMYTLTLTIGRCLT